MIGKRNKCDGDTDNMNATVVPFVRYWHLPSATVRLVEGALRAEELGEEAEWQPVGKELF